MSDLTLIHSKCALCRNSVPSSEVFCSNCGYPQHGTVGQKEIFKKERAQKRKTLETSKNRIYRVTGVLGFVAVFATIGFLIVLFTNQYLPYLMVGGVAIIIYGGLAYWSLQKPFPAVLTGLILYSTFFLYDLVHTINQGQEVSITSVVFRLVILYFFISGVFAAKKIVQLEKELSK